MKTRKNKKDTIIFRAPNGTKQKLVDIAKESRRQYSDYLRLAIEHIIEIKYKP